MVHTIAVEHKKSAGIYEIRNRVNGKVYVGSTVSFARRAANHKLSMLTSKCTNDHLSKAVVIDGAENFILSVLVIVEPLADESRKEFIIRLRNIEQNWILSLRANEKQFGYNLRVDAHSNRGIKQPKTAKALKGRKLSDETRRRMAQSRQGEKANNVKLTATQVKYIKVAVFKGAAVRQIARQFGVTAWAIQNIVNDLTWRSVQITQADIDNSLVEKYRRSNYTEQQILDVKRLLKDPLTQREISKQTGVNDRTVSNIKRGIIHKD